MKSYPSFMSACKDYFGLKEGQTSVEFLKEVKDLTSQDRADMVIEFNKIGINIEKV